MYSLVCYLDVIEKEVRDIFFAEKKAIFRSILLF